MNFNNSMFRKRLQQVHVRSGAHKNVALGTPRHAQTKNCVRLLQWQVCSQHRHCQSNAALLLGIKQLSQLRCNADTVVP